MKNKTIIFFSIVAIFLTTGCSPYFLSQGNRYVSIDPTFKPYVDRFFQFSKSFGKAPGTGNLVVTLDYSMSPPRSGQAWVLAVCVRSGDNPPTIRVNSHFWDNSYYTHAEREELIFHELGHCVLNRGHRQETAQTLDYKYYMPVSIMNPYHIGRDRYSINYEYYIKELFNQSPEIALYSRGPSLFDIAYYTGEQEPTNPVAVIDPPPPITGPIKPPVSASTAVAMGKMNSDGQFDIENIHCGEEEQEEE